jgi:predicted transcriptional regulator
MKKLSIATLLLTSFFLVGCASALKKRCENTNWYEYGESVAMQGRRLGSDTFLQQCEKEDAPIDHSAANKGFLKGMDAYCSPDVAYLTGKKGDFLSQDLCDGPNIKTLKKRHGEGVNDYCQKSNGYQAGASGKGKYNNVCPANLEAAFLPEFNRGRKNFLSEYVRQKESELSNMNYETSRLENQRGNLKTQITVLESANIISKARYGNMPAPPNSPESEIDSKISSLRWDLRKIEKELDSKTKEQQKIQQEIRDARTEMVGLNG